MADKQSIPLSTVKQLLAQQRDDFKAMIDSLMKSFNERQDKLHTLVVEVKLSLEYSQKDIEALQESNAESEITSALLLKESLEPLVNKIDYIENQSRRNNVIFDGILEDSKETWQETEVKVHEVLKSNMGFSDNLPIERAHRVGAKKAQKSRAIVVKFSSYKDREAVLRNGKKLKGSAVYVREDLSERILERRRVQLDQLKQARAQGKIAYFNYDRLIVKNRVSVGQVVSADSPVSSPEFVPNRPTTRLQSATNDNSQLQASK